MIGSLSRRRIFAGPAFGIIGLCFLTILQSEAGNISAGELGLLGEIEFGPLTAGCTNSRDEGVWSLFSFAPSGTPRNEAKGAIHVSHGLVEEKSDAHLGSCIVLAHVGLIRVEHDPRVPEVEVGGQLNPPFGEV